MPSLPITVFDFEGSSIVLVFVCCSSVRIFLTGISLSQNLFPSVAFHIEEFFSPLRLDFACIFRWLFFSHSRWSWTSFPSLSFLSPPTFLCCYIVFRCLISLLSWLRADHSICWFNFVAILQSVCSVFFQPRVSHSNSSKWEWFLPVSLTFPSFKFFPLLVPSYRPYFSIFPCLCWIPVLILFLLNFSLCFWAMLTVLRCFLAAILFFH